MLLTAQPARAQAPEPAQRDPDGSTPPPGPAKRTAQEQTERGESQTDVQALARHHFLTGVKLYRDQNYAGALAEFEAAYALKPGAGSLQNIALCLKALFRYAEAAERLKLLLTEHAAQLDAAEQQAVRDAIEELSALVGVLVVQVEPPEATVAIDGQATDHEVLTAGVQLNVGEHSIVAEAPGYARVTRVVRVAGGQQLTESLRLKPTAGFVTVRTGDPNAAIAIDGKPLAFERWSGPVAPGRRLLQVYKPGYQPHEQRVEVKLGESLRIHASVGPAQSARDTSWTQPPDETAETDSALPPKQQRGFYALASLTAFNLGSLPEGLKIKEQDERAGGGAAGGRAGYRVWTPLAAEAMLEYGRHEVPNTCIDPAATEEECQYTYNVDSLRVGGNLRLMSGGERLRFTSVAGSGAVYRKLKLEDLGSARGVDPYLLLELGAQLNLGHIVLEVDFVASVEGTAGTTGNLFGGDEGDDAAGEVYRKSEGGLQLFGFGIRGGWSEWAPRKTAKLLQPAGTR